MSWVRPPLPTPIPNTSHLKFDILFPSGSDVDGVDVGTTTKLTFEEFQKLPEREGAIYELDEGELLMEPSPAARHNLIRQRITMQLMQFVESKHLGIVLEEMDFRLAPDTVRNPDVAFVNAENVKRIDLEPSPINGPPALAVAVVYPGNRAEDIAKKTQQYL